jgi:hypothetical protein
MRGLSLVEQVERIETDDVRSKMEVVSGFKGTLLRTKFESIFFYKNHGFQQLQKLSRSFDASDDVVSSTSSDPAVLSSLAYVPLTSVDLERSFSELKNILRDKRQSMKIETVEQHLVMMYNIRYWSI